MSEVQPSVVEVRSTLPFLHSASILSSHHMFAAVVFAAAVPSGSVELVPGLWMGQTALAGIASGAPCSYLC